MNKITKIIKASFICFTLCACAHPSATDQDEASTEKGGQWNVYTYSETENGIEYNLNEYTVSGEDELADLLDSAQSVFKLPSYIPEGYEFESAYLHYYLTRDTLDGLVPREETSKDGTILYQYDLPDTVLSQIDGFHIVYADSSGQQLIIDADYVQSMDMDTLNSHLTEAEAVNYDLSRVGESNDSYNGEFFREVSPIYVYEGNAEIKNNYIYIAISLPEGDTEQIVRIAESM